MLLCEKAGLCECERPEQLYDIMISGLQPELCHPLQTQISMGSFNIGNPEDLVRRARGLETNLKLQSADPKGKSARSAMLITEENGQEGSTTMPVTAEPKSPEERIKELEAKLNVLTQGVEKVWTTAIGRKADNLFLGACYICGEAGHKARNCPHSHVPVKGEAAARGRGGTPRGGRGGQPRSPRGHGNYGSAAEPAQPGNQEAPGQNQPPTTGAPQPTEVEKARDLAAKRRRDEGSNGHQDQEEYRIRRSKRGTKVMQSAAVYQEDQ